MKGFFYTNVQLIHKKIYVRGYKDGEYFSDIVHYKPTIFLPSNEDTGWRSLKGESLKPVVMRDIQSMTDYVDGARGSMSIHGFCEQNEQVYAYINELIPDEVKYDSSLIRTLFFDIETETEGGYGRAWDDPFQKINCITIWIKDIGYIVWGLNNSYDPKSEDVEYRMFDNEGDLLHDFCKTFGHERPDIITGWNINLFDVPYIINRIEKYHNPDWVKLLSPWKLKAKERNRNGDRVYDIPGVASYDYMKLYKKFNLAPRESYSLNSITTVELDEKKVDYSEYDSLHDLYKNNWEKFVDYNIKDTGLVRRLDDKLKFIDLAITYGYIAKVNLEDVFGTVKYWDVYIHNHLYKKKIAVPPKVRNHNDVSYPGGYVKDPITGMYEWIASFDLNSLYPNIIVQYNISPETILDINPYPSNSPEKSDIVHGILDGTIDRSIIDGNDVCMAANGCYFTKEKQGFLPEMVESGYEMRKYYKNLMIRAQDEYEKTQDPKKKELAGQYDSLQRAFKIQLNSLYGALGTIYFRYFDIRLAEAVTVTGQTTILLTEKKTNEYLNNLLGTGNYDYVVGIDTDSVFLRLGKFIDRIYNGKLPKDASDIITTMDKFGEDKLIPVMTKGYDHLYAYLNGFKPRMVIKRESLGDRGLWVAKKRYVINVYDNEGVRYHEPKLKIKGLEIVRTSTPEMCRDAIKKAVGIMFNEGEEATQKYIADFKLKFDESPADAIAFPRGINNIEKFGGSKEVPSIPIHIRGALNYNKALKKFKVTKKYEPIREGEKIKFMYLKMPNVLNQNVIAFPSFLPPEFELDEFIDYDMQFEKSFISPIKNLLDAIGWEVEKRNTLNDLFS